MRGKLPWNTNDSWGINMIITILLPPKTVVDLDPLSLGTLRYRSGRALNPVFIPICCMISCGLRDLSGLIQTISRLSFAKGTIANKTKIIAGLYRNHHRTIDEGVREDISGPLPPTPKLGCVYPLQEVRMDVLTDPCYHIPHKYQSHPLNFSKTLCILHITTVS